MIDKIENFLVSCFNQECAVHVEHRKKKNLINYNSAFDLLNLYTINNDSKIPSKIGFGLTLLKKWHEKEFFEELEFLPEIHPRYLYKISEYRIENEKIWACYTSNSNPSKGPTKLLSNCFIVKEVNGELKITTNLIPDYDTKVWKKVGGYDFEYGKLENPILIKRFMSPSNDDWSIQEYNKNS
jgi:hypothetical protein